MNYTSIPKIKTRIHSIIDLVLIQYDQSQTNIYGLNQAKLQQWCHMLKQLIVEKERVVEPIYIREDLEEIGADGGGIVLPAVRGVQREIDTGRRDGNGQDQKERDGQVSENSYERYDQNQFIADKLLQIVLPNKIIVHRINTPPNPPSQTEFRFPTGTLKPHSSNSQISPTKFLLSGGTQPTNPTQKSLSICIFDTETGKITKVSELVEGVSSHGSVYVPPRVYFVGGRKSQGVVTRMCGWFDVTRGEVGEIAGLNYGAASMSLVAWRNKFIYKIGGVGDCFGDWNLSPYIQRYSIEQDYWQVINPQIPKQSIKQFYNFQLFAHSMAYITKKDQIVIFGGFDIDKKDTNFGCIIQIQAENQNKTLNKIQNKESLSLIGNQIQFNEQDSHWHEIKEFGNVAGLEPGGYWNSYGVLVEDTSTIKNKDYANKVDIKTKKHKQYLYLLQTTVKNGLNTKLIKLELK